MTQDDEDAIATAFYNASPKPKEIGKVVGSELMPINEIVERHEDMGRGFLRIFRQEDGDVCVMVIDDDGTMAGIEFCQPMSGGGKSPRVLAALNALGLAIVADNGSDD